ncbi:adenine phosphoribosyltransferase [Kitasatospora griseola]|uniref:Adenine phosphoribosyltransferase n=1 Tax=Kitasatospora griseola TaxID=2064 RepID=A0A0D0Q312_KITGR|nr:adenine phosphoribosyltransferase [Kitasatospora griseola]KIQ66947.1 adenine phosphoribosyltransferase [Kitasatospora griseola]GGQ76975.1 adenine phosphoribosyltransferase [Kitasatospora griseola]
MTSTIDPALTELLNSRIRDVQDYPKPGVLFKDIAPLLADAEAFGALTRALAERAKELGATKVVGLEARGFVLAAPAAVAAGLGFVPIRKKGKLPGDVFSRSYDLEYGSATLEVQCDAFAPGEKVLVVDDVLATGGTIAASLDLVQEAGAELVGVVVLMELGFLTGRERLVPHLHGAPLETLVVV